MKKQPDYLVIVSVCEGEPTGTPEIVKFADFEHWQREASEVTGGNCGYKVLAEIAGEDYQTVSKTVSDCNSKKCSYFTHYQVFFKISDENPHQLAHEAFHSAEDRCEIAQKQHSDYVEKHGYAGSQAESLERSAAYWERKICA